MAVAIFIGIVAFAMGTKGEIPLYETSADAEKSIISISTLLSENGVIAALVAGVILSGILACTMSTSDSQLLAASSSVSQNLIVDALKVNLSDKKKLLIARITVVIIAIIGVVIAWEDRKSVV